MPAEAPSLSPPSPSPPPPPPSHGRALHSPWGPRLPLPFEKHTAFGRWLEDHLGATKERVFHKGKQRRVYVVDYNKVIE